MSYSGHIPKSEKVNRLKIMNSSEIFTFVVGKQEYKTTLAFACYISPYISRMNSIDATYNRMELKINDEEFLFKKYLDGEEVDFDFLCYVSLLLNNPDLCQKAKNRIPLPSVSEVIPMVKKFSQFNLDISQEIKLIAKNFEELSTSPELLELSDSVLTQIFTSKYLKVSNENILWNFIKSTKKKHFYKYVRADLLSIGELKEFLSKCNLSDITDNQWDTVKSLIFQSENLTDKEEQFPYSNNSKGIFYYLQEKYQNNLVNSGIINIETSSEVTDQENPKYWLDHNSTRCFGLNNSPDQWVQFDFKNKKVAITYYSIVSYLKNEPYILSSWCLSGSNDGVNWKIIDSQSKNNELSKKGIVNIKVKKTNSKFRYISLKVTGKNEQNDYFAYFSWIELYGSLFK